MAGHFRGGRLGLGGRCFRFGGRQQSRFASAVARGAGAAEDLLFSRVEGGDDPDVVDRVPPVVGGVLVMLYLWGPGSRMWRSSPEQLTNRLEVTGLYWHFVDLVWIFLFPVLYLL